MTAADRCRSCGSASLFSAWVGPDGLAVTGPTEDGARYATHCQDCGSDQDAPARRRTARRGLNLAEVRRAAADMVETAGSHMSAARTHEEAGRPGQGMQSRGIAIGLYAAARSLLRAAGLEAEAAQVGDGGR